MVKFLNLFILLKALSEKGAYEEADLLFKKVHEIHPENATFLVHRGKKVYFWN